MSNIPYTVTERGLTAFIDGVPRTVPCDHPNFEDAVDSAEDGDLNRLREILNIRTYVANILSQGRISIEGDQLFFNGEELDLESNLIIRIVQLRDQNRDITPWLNFVDNLIDNPDYNSFRQTFNFLNDNDLPITSDGCFLAYKAVRPNLTDKRTGNFDNSVGAVVKMNRRDVENNPYTACAPGLHVCSRAYLSSFGGNEDRIVVCKVNPADVVSVPHDYEGSKVRCCRYQVVGEISDKQMFMNMEYHLPTGFTDEYAVNNSEFADSPHDVEGTHEGAHVKLNEEAVRQIKTMLADGNFTKAFIARQFYVSERQIRRIETGENWGGVTI